jgi:hypothetical protein
MCGNSRVISVGREAEIGDRFDLYVEKDKTLRFIPVKGCPK